MIGNEGSMTSSRTRSSQLSRTSGCRYDRAVVIKAPPTHVAGLPCDALLQRRNCNPGSAKVEVVEIRLVQHVVVFRPTERHVGSGTPEFVYVVAARVFPSATAHVEFLRFVVLLVVSIIACLRDRSGMQSVLDDMLGDGHAVSRPAFDPCVKPAECRRPVRPIEHEEVREVGEHQREIGARSILRPQFTRCPAIPTNNFCVAEIVRDRESGGTDDEIEFTLFAVRRDNSSWRKAKDFFRYQFDVVAL